MERRLTVILAADVAGFTRLIAADEEGTLATLATYRTTIFDLIAEHAGRVFGSSGDGFVAEFRSAVQGIRAAVAIQRALNRRNADLPPERRMEFRIGLNLGEVVIEGDDLLGDGVNVAARLQEAALPGGICISGGLRDQIAGKLDFQLTALGERRLKNLPQPVALHRVEWQREDPIALGALGGTPMLPEKPSIAILPFVNMSGDAEQEFFADGLTEDIITALSHYRWFFVIARNSSFAYKGRAVDVKQIARELGVRYVLEGSVRKAGARVRVTGQLVDATTGAHLWAERYDRDYADIFAIQDELTQQVVGAIEPELLMVEGHRAIQKPTGSLGAYECCMRGMWHHYQTTADHMAEAIRWQRRAIELDPGFGRAHMALARTLWGTCLFGYTDDTRRDVAELCAEAEAALRIDDRDPYSHYIMFGAHFSSGRLPQALAEAQRAIDLNPNFALGHNALGWARIFIGHFTEALEPLHTALRLSPNDPLAFLFLSRIALAHYHLGNFEEAAHYAERALAIRRLHFILVVQIAALGQLGQADEAESAKKLLAEHAPADLRGYWEAVHPYAEPSHRAHLFDGLTKAGVRGEELADLPDRTAAG